MAEKNITVRLRAMVDQYRGAMRQAGQETRRFGGSVASTIRQNEAAFTRMGMAATTMGLVAAAGIRSVVRAGAEFERGMNQVRAVSGATEDEMASMSETARELGATTRFSATEAADGLGFLAMAGFDAAQATQALPGVLELAAAGAMSLGQAADIASNVLTGYGMEAREIGRVNDVMAATFTTTNTNLAQLGEAMKFAAPVANAAGVQFEEAAAAIGLMGNAGIQASMAGTSLRGAIARLLQPSSQAAEVMARLGVNAETAEGGLVPLHEIIEQLETSGATTGDMMVLFGQRAGPAMAALVEQGADALRDQTQVALDSSGRAAEIAGIQMEGFAGSMIELRSAAEGLRIALFEAGLGDVAESFVDALTGMFRVLEGAPQPVQTAAVAIGGLTAVFGTVGGAALLMAPRIVHTMDVLRDLGGVASLSRRGLVGFTRFMTGPWGIALAAGALAIGEFARRAAEAQKATQALQGHLEDVASGADVLSDAWIRQQLEGAGVLHTWQQLGIDMDTLRGALRGVPEDVRTVEGALRDNRSMWDDISDATNRVTFGLAGSTDQYRELHRTLGHLGVEMQDFLPLLEEQEQLQRSNEASTARLTGLAEHYGAEVGQASTATDGYAGSLDDATRQTLLAIDPTGELAEEFGAIAGEASDAASALDEYLDAARRASDPVFRLFDALDRADEAQREYNEAVDEFGPNSEEAQAAAINLMGRLEDLEQAALDGDLSWEAFNERLDLFVARGDMSAEAADLIRDRVAAARGEVDRLPRDVQVRLRIEGHREANRNLIEIWRAAERAAGDYTVRMRVTSAGLRTFRELEAAASRGHDGGRVVPGGIRRFHDGGEAMPQLTPFGRLSHDEVPAILQVGEVVLSRRHVAALRDVMAPVVMHDGGRVSNTQTSTYAPQITVNGTADRQTLAEARHQQHIAYLQRR